MTAQDAIRASTHCGPLSIATPIDLKTNGARDVAFALNLSLGGSSRCPRGKTRSRKLAGERRHDAPK
jgi:hypothetical protein